MDWVKKLKLRLKISSLIGACFFTRVIFASLPLLAGQLLAQVNPLADTIWDGNAEITIPKMIWKKERPRLNRVETVSTVKFQVPIQIWFWGKNDSPSNAISVCFNQRKAGGDPLRAELTMFLGQLPTWAVNQLAKIHERRPRKDDSIYLWPCHSGLYQFSPRTKRVTFQLKNVNSDATDNVFITWRLEGSGSMAGNNLKQASFVVSEPTSLPRIDNYPVRPGDEKLISFQGNMTGMVLNIVKSVAKPSDQAAAQFSKFFDLQDQSP